MGPVLIEKTKFLEVTGSLGLLGSRFKAHQEPYIHVGVSAYKTPLSLSMLSITRQRQRQAVVAFLSTPWQDQASGKVGGRLCV